MIVSLRLNADDAALFKNYAKMHGISVSELIRQSVLERIEDDIDLKTYDKAMAAFEKNPVTYTHEEVAAIL